MVVQGICPDGWHVPAQEELARLRLYVVNDTKSTDYWIVPGGTNATGFNALPAGKYKSEKNRFEDRYGFTGYWTNSNVSQQFAHYYPITYYCSFSEISEAQKADGFSVRCVMDG